MQSTVRVEGARQLRAALKRATASLDDMKDANEWVAAFIATVAAARTPRRSGALAVSVRGNRAAGKATVSAGGAALPYAGPIHWGWPARNIAAQPWIREAAGDTETVWLRRYEKEVQEIVDRVHATTP